MMGQIYPVAPDIKVFTEYATCSINPRSTDTDMPVEMINKAQKRQSYKDILNFHHET